MRWTFLVLGLLAPGLSVAQLPVRDRTPAGELTGYFWLDLSPDARMNFLFGFQAGYRTAQPDAKSAAYVEWEESNPIPGGTYREVVEAIDQFFKEADNKPMPITAAMKIVKLKREGRPQTEIDERTARYRQAFVTAPREACENGTVSNAEECRARGYSFNSRNKPGVAPKP